MVHPDDVERVERDMMEARAEDAQCKTWHRMRFREARKDASWADVETLYTSRGHLFFGITRVRPLFFSCAPSECACTLGR